MSLFLPSHRMACHKSNLLQLLEHPRHSELGRLEHDPLVSAGLFSHNAKVAKSLCIRLDLVRAASRGLGDGTD